MTKNKLNGSVKWILLVIALASIVYGFGQKSQELEDADTANALRSQELHEHHVEDMGLVRDDLKIIMADIKKLLKQE